MVTRQTRTAQITVCTKHKVRRTSLMSSVPLHRWRHGRCDPICRMLSSLISNKHRLSCRVVTISRWQNQSADYILVNVAEVKFGTVSQPQPSWDGFEMSWTAEWRPSSQRALSTSGNSFKTVGEPFQVTTSWIWLRGRQERAELSSKQKVAALKNIKHNLLCLTLFLFTA